MSNQGEFKKWAKKQQKKVGLLNWKISELAGSPIVYKYKSHAFLLPMGDMFKIVDEAKKEFPCFKCPFLNTDNCHYCSGLYKQFLDFFLKWFGDQK